MRHQEKPQDDGGDALWDLKQYNDGKFKRSSGKERETVGEKRVQGFFFLLEIDFSP